MIALVTGASKGIGAACAAHLVQDDRNASLGDLPGGFRTGKAAADNVNGGRERVCHGALIIMRAFAIQLESISRRGQVKRKSVALTCERRLVGAVSNCGRAAA